MRIAVYGISKNESAFVQAWADSCADADYRILVDTGSTDDTAALAVAAGVSVVTQVFDPWRFDVARNHALSLIPEDVDLCISLDLDEVLLPGWRAALEAAFMPSITRYRYLYTWSWRDDGHPGLQYAGDKIHGRHTHTWRYPVHEVLIPVGEETQGWAELQIHHHRDDDKSRAQYLPLLELAVSENYEDDRNAHYLAREYMYYERFEEAAAEFKRHLAMPTARWEAERSESMRYLAKCEPDNAEHWLKLAIQTTPDRREPWVDLAFLYLEEKRWHDCLETCESALTLDRKIAEYLTAEHAWGSRLNDMAANAAFQLQRYGLAVEHAQKAVALEPTDSRLHSNLAHMRSSFESWAPALIEIDGLPTWRRLPTSSIVTVAPPLDALSDWVLMNPSISSDGTALRMTVRVVNYRLNGNQYDMVDEDRVIRTRIGIVDVDSLGVASQWQWVDDSAALCPHPLFPVEGVEDARLFRHQDKWWILGAIRDFASSGSIRQVLAEVRDEPAPTLDRPWRLPSPLTSDDSASVYEKNWVPIALSPSSLDVVWSTDPFVQLRLDSLTRQVVPVSGRSTALATHDLRGSTPVFTTPHGPVYVVHEVGPLIFEGDRPHRTYLHRFVTYCDDHVLIGQPWTIEGLALEYVAGAAFLNDTLYLSYGRDDQLAKVAVCSWDEISYLIQKTC